MIEKPERRERLAPDAIDRVLLDLACATEHERAGHPPECFGIEEDLAAIVDLLVANRPLGPELGEVLHLAAACESCGPTLTQLLEEAGAVVPEALARYARRGGRC